MKHYQINNLFKKHYQINKPGFQSKILSLISIVSLLISIGIYGYLYSISEDKLGFSDGKTYTVSRSLANGNKEGMILFATIGFLALIFLVLVRTYVPFYKYNLSLLLISYTLLITIMWVTVDKNKTAHYILAGIIFSSIFIFEILNYFVIYQNTKKHKYIFISLLILNFISLVILITTGSLDNDYNMDIFAGFEIFFLLLFLGSLYILGFF